MGSPPRPINPIQVKQPADDAFTPLRFTVSPVPGDPASITLREMALDTFRLEDVGKPATFCGFGDNSQISAFGGRSASGETILCLRCCVPDNQIFLAAYGPNKEPIAVRPDHRRFLAKQLPAAESKIAYVLTEGGDVGLKANGTNPNGSLVYNYKSRDLKVGLGGKIGVGAGATLTANGALTLDKNQDFKSANLDAQLANAKGKLVVKVTLSEAAKPKYVAEGEWKLKKNITLSGFADPSWKPDLSPPKAGEMPKWPGRGQYGVGIRVSF